VQCCQWKNRIIIALPHIVKVLKSRRASKALASLIPLFEKEPKIKITYNELAKRMGYVNRSGSYKAIKILERFGVVAVKDGYLYLTMGELILTYGDAA